MLAAVLAPLPFHLSGQSVSVIFSLPQRPKDAIRVCDVLIRDLPNPILQSRTAGLEPIGPSVHPAQPPEGCVQLVARPAPRDAVQSVFTVGGVHRVVLSRVAVLLRG
jgi:hypothetical protein